MTNSTIRRGGMTCRRTRLLLLALVVSLAGCNGREPIRHYRVPKPELVYEQNHVTSAQSTTDVGDAPTEPTDRLLGAILTRDRLTWYFKMTGPKDLVASQESAFGDLIASVQFRDTSAPPSWSLPEGWTQQTGPGQRLATLRVDVEGQSLETSVISLPTSASSTSILDNVNRWRRQMRLSGIGPDELNATTTQITSAAGTAVLVNMVGNFRPSSMGRSTTPPMSRNGVPNGQ